MPSSGDQRREQRGQLVDVGTARLGRPDRGHDLGVEDVGVDVDPEPAHVARGDTVENGRCRLGERGRTDGGPNGRDRCPGQVANTRDGERLVAVPLALVAPPDQCDVLTAHERHRTCQPRELCVAAPHGESEAHARDRPSHRFFRAREIGVPVDIDEPYPAWVGARAATGTVCTQEAAQHDAAIAADDDEQPIVVDPGRDWISERPAVDGHARLVPGLAGRTLEVPVGRRRHVAEVRRVQPLDQAQIPERRGRAIHLLGRTGLIVRPEADARWRSQDCDMAHRARLPRGAAT